MYSPGEGATKIIRLIAFLGASLKYATLLDPTDDPLLIVGHVGLQFDSASIYGFHTPEWAIEAEGGLQASFARLRAYQDMPGTIQDDTPVFHRAFNLNLRHPPAMGDRLAVYAMNYDCEADEFYAIRDRLMQWYTEERVFRYGYPPILPDTSYDNCATIQRRLGMQIVEFEEHKGWMGDYIEVFRAHGELWIPEE